VTGPNTVIDAIASGKKAAQCMDRYLQNQPLVVPAVPKLPGVFIEPAGIDDTEAQTATRAEPAVLPPVERLKNVREVTLVLTEEQARSECRRCLRCDLEFTRTKSRKSLRRPAIGGGKNG
jgi:NADH-quinone oxidoreductase subunit F